MAKIFQSNFFDTNCKKITFNVLIEDIRINWVMRIYFYSLKSRNFRGAANHMKMEDNNRTTIARKKAI